MALYLSLSLLAVLLAFPSTGGEHLGEIFLTAIGLLVAHLVAFGISSRLVSKGVLDEQARLVAFAQIVGGIAVIVLVMLPLLVLAPPVSLQVAQALMLGFVAYVGYVAARQADVSRGRALRYVGFVVASVMIVLLVKSLAGH